MRDVCIYFVSMQFSYAYGVSLSVCLWIGQLSLDLYDASEPHKSVMAFYRILNTLATKSGMEEICSEFNIETARAAVAYRWVADCATADGVVQTALRSSLQVNCRPCTSD